MSFAIDENDINLLKEYYQCGELKSTKRYNGDGTYTKTAYRLGVNTSADRNHVRTIRAIYNETRASVWHGEYVEWHCNGKIALVCTFVNGKQEGILSIYNEFGRITERSIMKDGKLNGESRQYVDVEEGLTTTAKLQHVNFYRNNKIITNEIIDSGIIKDFKNISTEEKTIIKLVYGVNCL